VEYKIGQTIWALAAGRVLKGVVTKDGVTANGEINAMLFYSEKSNDHDYWLLQPAVVFATKEEAVDRGIQIAKNKIAHFLNKVTVAEKELARLEEELTKGSK
jgi:hypothetical protein